MVEGDMMNYNIASIVRLAGFALALAAMPLLHANPCPPAVSLSVSISPTYTYGGASASSAVYPDSSMAYVDGVGGVSAGINGCTHDVVINLANSTRTVGFDFRNAVATNSNTPSWTATPFVTRPHMVVSNLLFNYNPSAYYQFTTDAEMTVVAPDGTSPQLQFVNPFAQAASIKGGLANQPDNTSLVVVTHTPADPSTGAVETWVVTPDNTNMNPAGSPAATQVGGLITSTKHGAVNAGQFSMPFQFTITRK